ncbi:hypothetical protein PV328_004642 [Microctonus aethiopoides]|uniref:Chitin-binding type-2 domain-containing protein n=1 Tax=Microctonus aethiopoides TaxID=144406 RepID=A0AA39FB75_9HYME|nr:hypothetical protein PV328_004642 [Microctonus aethiopoides]
MIRQFFIAFIGMIAIVLINSQQHKSHRPTPVFRESITQLTLPNNATAIRDNIIDNFSCENRIYGYYADIDNECQIFHVCLPQNRGSIRWSFICPAETVFNQETFVCTRTNNSIPCEESEKYYILNEEFGKEDEPENPEDATYDPLDIDNELPVTPFYPRDLRARRKAVTSQNKNRRVSSLNTQNPVKFSGITTAKSYTDTKNSSKFL